MSDKFLEFMGLDDLDLSKNSAEDESLDEQQSYNVNEEIVLEQQKTEATEAQLQHQYEYNNPLTDTDTVSADVEAQAHKSEYEHKNASNEDMNEAVENAETPVSAEEQMNSTTDEVSEETQFDEKKEALTVQEMLVGTGNSNNNDGHSHKHHHKHRHKHRKNKKKMSKGMKIGITVAVVLIFIAVVIFGGFKGILAFGKAGLQKNATSSIPDLLSESVSIEESSLGIISYKGQKYQYNSSIVTILCMGIDSTETVDHAEFNFAGQADSIFLLVLDEKAKKTSLVAIPRDTMTEVTMPVDTSGNYRTDRRQLCLQYAYWDGGEKSGQEMMKTVSKLMYNVPVHGYIAMGMRGISTLNDTIGGVKVTVLPNDNGYYRKSGYSAGQNITLHGDDAFWYVKYRDTSVSQSNNLRIARQKQYLNNFMGTFKSAFKNDVTLPVKMYQNVNEYINTGISIDQISYIASLISDFSFNADEIYTVEGTIAQPGKHEELTVNEEALQDLIVNVFYNPINN